MLSKTYILMGRILLELPRIRELHILFSGFALLLLNGKKVPESLEVQLAELSFLFTTSLSHSLSSLGLIL